VGTQEDRPAGRKRLLTPTPVGKWCLDESVKAHKIRSVNSPEFIGMLKEIKPDIILVVSFGQLLKEEALSLPSGGCVNIHASLLPAYRGASPVAAAILNGDSKTGVTFMKMERGLDTGPVYRMFEMPLDGTEKAGELEVALGKLAAGKAPRVINEICRGELSPLNQDETDASYAGKIKKCDGVVDWTEPAKLLERKVRAYNPWPGMSFTLEKGKKKVVLKINEASFAEEKGSPGEIVEAGKNSWKIACGSGALELKKLVPRGKKEMTGPEFLRGCPGTVKILAEQLFHP
jgi:methionyl-tRNA formyltransferase